jgi:hypothetical protein
MALKQIGVIEIPHSRGSSFDHGAFDAKTRRVFVAHTGRDCIEVIDHDAGKHIATLQGFTEAAGVVAEDGQVLVTNRGAASLAWVDARTLKTHAVFATGPTPNGVAIAPRRRLAIAACIGNEAQGPTLQVIGLDGGPQHTINLPGRPRWCVTDAAAERVFLAIREPSMILVADLPALNKVEHWKIPAAGAHGLEIDREADRLFVACDDRALVQVNIASGKATHQWPLTGVPDVAFFSPTTGLVHVAIGDPGLVHSIDPRNGASTQHLTGTGAHTTAYITPDRLYVFSPQDGGVLVLSDT